MVSKLSQHGMLLPRNDFLLGWAALAVQLLTVLLY
jgi:hypothetical protein